MDGKGEVEEAQEEGPRLAANKVKNEAGRIEDAKLADGRQIVSRILPSHRPADGGERKSKRQRKRKGRNEVPLHQQRSLADPGPGAEEGPFITYRSYFMLWLDKPPAPGYTPHG